METRHAIQKIKDMQIRTEPIAVNPQNILRKGWENWKEFMAPVAEDISRKGWEKVIKPVAAISLAATMAFGVVGCMRPVSDSISISSYNDTKDALWNASVEIKESQTFAFQKFQLTFEGFSGKGNASVSVQFLDKTVEKDANATVGVDASRTYSIPPGAGIKVAYEGNDYLIVNQTPTGSDNKGEAYIGVLETK
jgi:hypothetical protein